MRLWAGLLGSVVGLGATLAALSSTSVVEPWEDPDTDTTDAFMWSGANNFLPQDSFLFRTELAYAERQNMNPYESGIHDAKELRHFLRFCRDAGIERSWIEIGPNDGVTSEAFATDSSARAPTLDRFRSLARASKAHDPKTVRMTIFDEAPLGTFDPNPDASYQERVAAFREHGPEGFAHHVRPVPDTHRSGTSRTYSLAADAPLDTTRRREWQHRIFP